MSEQLTISVHEALATEPGKDDRFIGWEIVINGKRCFVYCDESCLAGVRVLGDGGIVVGLD